MLTSPDLGMVLSMVEPSSVLSNSESLGRLTGTFLLFLLPLQAAGVVPRTQFVPSGQLVRVPVPAVVSAVVQLPQPAGGVRAQDNAVVGWAVGQLASVGTVVASVQGQVVVGSVQRVPEGQIAVATVEVSAAAAELTALHLQATTGAFITICQVQSSVLPAVHLPTLSGAGAVQPEVQSTGALRTQASSAPGGRLAAATIVSKRVGVHPSPVGATASEAQVHSGAASGGFLHVTSAQVAPVVGVAAASVTGAPAAAVEASAHWQAVG